jgi:hypothetical protein
MCGALPANAAENEEGDKSGEDLDAFYHARVSR